MYLPSSRSDIDTYIGLLAVIVNENRTNRHSACLSSYQIVELTLPYDIQSVLLLPSVLKTIKRSVVIKRGVRYFLKMIFDSFTENCLKFIRKNSLNSQAASL